jgi:DnaJ-class molecular chaperone
MGSGEMTDDEEQRFDRFVDMVDSYLESIGDEGHTCPHCSGTGEDMWHLDDCWYCEGEGVLYDD